MGKSIRIDEATLERIKNSLSDELYSTVERATAELDDIITWLENFDEDTIDDIDLSVSGSLSVYCIIRLVTFLETVLKTSFIILIDEYDRDFDLQITTNLEHLKQIRNKKEFTNGKIVADSLNFQRFESDGKELDIFKIFSKVLDIDDVYHEMVVKNSNIPKIRENISNLIKERHSIVHELRYTTWEVKQIEEAYKSVVDFIVIINIVIKEFRKT